MKKTPGSRREGRALAVQLIYMLDHNSTPLDEVLVAFMNFRKDDDEPLAPVEKSRKFCEGLARGVVQHWRDLDRQIQATTANFALNRIGGVERAILRLGAYEMLYCLETPPVVAINEAVELAKRFSSDEAGRFVNGVLDKIRETLKRPSRIAVTPYTPPKSVDRVEEQMEKTAEKVARELGEHSTEPPQEFSPGRDEKPEQR